MSLQEESPSAGSADGITEVVAQLARVRDSELLARFVGAYLRRAPSADADAPEEEPEALLAEARGAFALADGRGGAIAGVRAFTPRREEHGYEAAGSVLETNTDDLPFLVDSVGAELTARGLRIIRVTHPIVGVRRDPAPPHRITAIEHPREAPRESVMHFELDRRLSPEELADLEDAARHVLATVRAVVDDFPALQGGSTGWSRSSALVARAWPRPSRIPARSRRSCAGSVTTTSSSSACTRTRAMPTGACVPRPAPVWACCATRARPASCACRPTIRRRLTARRATPPSWRSPRPTPCRRCTAASR